MFKRLTLAAATTLALSACHGPAEDFRQGVPREEMVKLNVPQSSTSALEYGQQQSGLKGDHSGFYDLTRGSTVIINGGAVVVLGLVKAITDNPPTSLNGNTAVWGPHTDALSANTWKLTVNKTGAKTYSYALEGKAKTAPDSAYVVVLSGTHTAGAVEGVGNGDFLLDWDKAQTLPEHDQNVGSAEFTYSRDASGKVAVSTHFSQVKDGDTGNRIDADYAYSTTPGQGGDFEFATVKNIDSDASRPAAEHLTVKSRWLETGAGRSDAKATGGDLGSDVAMVNECWDTNFNSQYANFVYTSYHAGYGTESTDCAIQGASYAN